METTEKQRQNWKTIEFPHGAEHYLAQASRDIDRILAALAQTRAERDKWYREAWDHKGDA